MVSFLMNCPQCGSMIAKGIACPDCGWADIDEEGEILDANNVKEFKRREKVHKRNYFVFMTLTLVTGFFSMIIAILWYPAIWLGSGLAFDLIVLLSIPTAGLGLFVTWSRRRQPVELKCPSCEIRLDGTQMTGERCPSCLARLQ